MREEKKILGFFQHIECIQIAGQSKLSSEEVIYGNKKLLRTCKK